MNVLVKAMVLATAATIQGFAMAVFLFPHYIPTGGAASVAVLINYVFQIPFELTLWILNAGLLFAAVKWLGKGSAVWTLFCVSVTALTIKIFAPYTLEPVLNVVFDLIFGSLLFGVGIGILFRMGASSGGMDILALLISKVKGYPPGKTLFVINGSILLITGIIVDFKIILFAIAGQYISTFMLDLLCKFKINRTLEKQEI